MSIKERADAFFAEDHIAIVGVSRSNGTGNGIFNALRDRGLHVIPVNPNMETYEGEPCYRKVQEIPDDVASVVIVTSPEITDTIARDCVTAGVRHVWMHNNPMFGKRNSSVSAEATTFLRDKGVNVIDGACPLMFGEKADFAHKCMRSILSMTGNLPR